MNCLAQRAVALVITLIMLSVVTFMTVAFLALSRRERASVTLTTDQTIATLMADAAFERAKAEIVARLSVRTNAFAYDFIVSTNFLNPSGFQSGNVSPLNVNYAYPNGQPLSPGDQVTNIANLHFDPRPPVYVVTNAAGSNDFRFFLDFNRNGQFESNGWLPVIANNGQFLLANGATTTDPKTAGLVSNFFVGDPEWVGIPDQPGPWPLFRHSRTNRFIGRYAYIVLPEGKSLDLNYMFNQARSRRWDPNGDGFMRNQGVGSWELNLAAFLQDLNTNQWPLGTVSYQYTPTLSSGTTFADAAAILGFRYRTNYNNLRTVYNLFGPAGEAAFEGDYIDGYSDGPLMTNIAALTIDDDNTRTKRWYGSDNLQLLSDIQELFTFTNAWPGLGPFSRRLWQAGTNVSSYDRYAFYRLLSQMGVDSTPASAGKLNVNYMSDASGLATNFLPWTPLDFFTNAADRLLRVGLAPMNAGLVTPLFYPTNLSITYIPIYPPNSNYYSAAVHRLLQVAVNIYDATTNRVQTAYPHHNLPSVFRPVFGVTNNNQSVYIAGYVEETGVDFLRNPWLDLDLPADRNLLANPVIRSNANVYGIPVVIGAKKGFPNFNEFVLQTAVQVSRKVEVRKPQPFIRPNQTNQMFLVGISNLFGVEAWNSYTQRFPRPLHVRVTNQFTIVLSNAAATVRAATRTVGTSTNIPGGAWLGQQFRLPLLTNVVFLPDMPLTTNSAFAPGLAPPYLGLTIYNRLQYIAIDTTTQRLVDFVNLDNLGTQLDLTEVMVGQQAFGQASVEGSFWQTNRFRTDPLSVGIRNQINTSLGQGTLTNNAIWQNYNQNAVSGDDKQKSIDLFRVFVGLNPIYYPRQQAQMQQELGNSIARQAPFTPTRKVLQTISWQVNDPLVHHMAEDLLDLEQTNTVQYVVPPQIVPTNSFLGQINRRYRPWGGNPNISSDTNAFNLALKDPMVRRSDDWDFPTNKLPNLGWLGRVHRGSPWQTIYLKSVVAETNAWRLWSGALIPMLSHPTNDWQILDQFTVAPNANAARGLLSVNQTNLAAWSAVLSGVSALSNSVPRALPPNNVSELRIEPNSPQLRLIVDNINATRLSRPGQTFFRLGEILASPALTVNSPFLNPLSTNITDAVYERLPQQILSLLKSDEPRLVIYAYGQSLAPAPNSLILSGPNRGLCTNYQITGEVIAKHVLRLDSNLTNPPGLGRQPLAIRAVTERFQYLSNE